MYDLRECRKKLLLTLDKEKQAAYFQLIRSWWLFKEPVSMIEFNAAVSKILCTGEELKAHNQFMYAWMAVKNMTYLKDIPKTTGTTEGPFRSVNPIDYMKQPTNQPQQGLNVLERRAASEYYFPNIGFITNRVDLQAWENGLDGCEKNVAEYVANLCQSFIKNILTAMISRKESYKVRDKHFQYGFGMPAPNLLLRNSNKIIDHTKESRVELTEEEDTFLPTCKPSIDVVEQQTAFAYACGSRTHSGGKLTVQLLYDTLRDNPHIVGLHSIHSTNLLRLGLQLED